MPTCRFFRMSSGCSNGAACSFSHSDDAPPARCPFFSSLPGARSCRFGAACTLAHIADNTRAPAAGGGGLRAGCRERSGRLPRGRESASLREGDDVLRRRELSAWGAQPPHPPMPMHPLLPMPASSRMPTTTMMHQQPPLPLMPPPPFYGSGWGGSYGYMQPRAHPHAPPPPPPPPPFAMLQPALTFSVPPPPASSPYPFAWYGDGSVVAPPPPPPPPPPPRCAPTMPTRAVLVAGSFADFLSCEVQPLAGPKYVSWDAFRVTPRGDRTKLASGDWDMLGGEYLTQPPDAIVALWSHYAAAVQAAQGEAEGEESGARARGFSRQQQGAAAAFAIIVRRYPDAAGAGPTRIRGYSLQCDGWMRCPAAVLRAVHTVNDATGEEIAPELGVEWE